MREKTLNIPNSNESPAHDLASSSIDKAKRLRKLREISRFTREEFAKMSGAQFSTYKGWENAKYNGIPERRALYLIRNLETEGITCSIDWIMKGAGKKPTKIHAHSSPLIISNQLPGFQDDSALIEQELKLFQSDHPDNLALVITDDAMEPFYHIGETVAGKTLRGKFIKKAIGKHCIIQTAQNEKLVRIVEIGQTKNRYTLLCTNPHTKEKQILHDMELTDIAPILWHRRHTL